MKPNPLSPLNHLTVPLGMGDHLWTRCCGSGGSALSVLPSRGSGPADRDNVCAHSSISMNALDGRGLRRRGHRGAIRRAPESSHHFQGDRAQKVALADLDAAMAQDRVRDRKSTRLNSSHMSISYAVFCLKKKKIASHINLGLARIV